MRLVGYAVHWIKALIQQHIMSAWSLIKIGTTEEQRNLFFNTQKQIDSGKYKQIVCDEMVIRMNRDVYISDDPEGEHNLLKFGGYTHEDLLIDLQDEYNVNNKLKNAISKLTPNEQFYVNNYFLVEDKVTRRSIAKQLNLSDERVRQIEGNALRKLKQYMSE
jgi:RNA polymerase sigma-32 factor